MVPAFQETALAARKSPRCAAAPSQDPLATPATDTCSVGSSSACAEMLLAPSGTTQPCRPSPKQHDADDPHSLPNPYLNRTRRLCSSRSSSSAAHRPASRSTIPCHPPATPQPTSNASPNPHTNTSSIQPAPQRLIRAAPETAAAAASFPIDQVLVHSKAAVFHVLRTLNTLHGLARACSVCHLWRDVGHAPSLWAAALERHLEQQGGGGVGGAASEGLASLPLQREHLLSTPEAQAGRWFGLRTLGQHADHLLGLHGACGAYDPASRRLAVLDQRRQAMAFLELEAEADMAPAGSGAAGASCEAGYSSVSMRRRQLPRVPPPQQQGGSRRELPPTVVVPVPETPLRSCEDDEDGSGQAPLLGAQAGAAAQVGMENELGEQEAGPGDGAGAAAVAASGPRLPARYDLPLVVACGDGLVASGHPDGAVKVWDCSSRSVVRTLAGLGGHRGGVQALAADGPLLASCCSRAEVRVWDATSGELRALVRHSLMFAPRSLAVSARHQLVALRSMDGIELHSATDGKWLHSIADRRNTSMVMAGDALLLVSSHPSFLGNSFLDFQIEITAIDIRPLAGWRTARMVSSHLTYDLRRRHLAEFKWDSQLHASLAGDGLLLVRCLQFPLAPGVLAWPCIFGFDVRALLGTLQLLGRGKATVGGEPAGRGGGYGRAVAGQDAGRAAGVADAAAAREAPAAPAAQQDAGNNAANATGPPRSAPVITVEPLIVWSGVRARGDEACEQAERQGISAVAASGGDDGGGSHVAHYPAGLQLLVTPRHVLYTSEGEEVWCIPIPFTQLRRQGL